MPLSGLVDTTAGTRVDPDTRFAASDALEAHKEGSDHDGRYATSTQGIRTDLMWDRGDPADLYIPLGADGELPALSGAALTRIPIQLNNYTASAVSVANTVAKTQVVALAIPAGTFWGNGAQITLDSYAGFNNSVLAGASKGYTLEIQINGTAVWSDDATNIAFNGTTTQRLIVTHLDFIRITDTTGLLAGRHSISNAHGTTGSIGDLSAGSRECPLLVAPVVLDYNAEITLSVHITLSEAAANLNWTGLYDLVRANVQGAITIPAPPQPPDPVRAWLEDQPDETVTTNLTGSGFAGQTTYPKISTGNLENGWPTNEQMATYHTVCGKISDTMVARVAAAQAINPNLYYKRYICPQEYQGATAAATSTISGPQFQSTAASTNLTTAAMFAGHWVYQQSSTTTTYLSASGTSVTVASGTGTRFTAGQYVAIYNAPVGSFANAEHCLISARVGDVLTLSSRGYKSTAAIHASGSIIAQHQLGNVTSAPGWMYNLSALCPQDGSGNRLWPLMAAWYAANIDKDKNGAALTLSGVTVHAWESDSDFPNIDTSGFSARAVDTDGDGVVDRGIDPSTGHNRWSEGLEAFYAAVRTGLTARGGNTANILCNGGMSWSMGLPALNGTQLESYPDSAAKGESVADYSSLAAHFFAANLHQDQSTYGPLISDAQNKILTPLYGGAGSNSTYRLCMALATIQGCYVSSQPQTGQSAYDGDTYFRYWDEQAVYTAGGSYGQSVAKSNLTDITANRGWLGAPTGPYERVYDQDIYAADQSLIGNNGFESALSGWTGNGVTVARDATVAHTDSASLKLTPTTYGGQYQHTTHYSSSPNVTLVAGQEYTLSCQVKAERLRRVGIQISSSNRIYALHVSTEWAPVVWVFRAVANFTGPIQFLVGQESAAVWIDELYLHASGQAGVLRRPFTNGMVVANITPTAKTITMPTGYQRILGTQEPSVNTGVAVGTSLTISAYDGIFLIEVP